MPNGKSRTSGFYFKYVFWASRRLTARFGSGARLAAVVLSAISFSFVIPSVVEEFRSRKRMPLPSLTRYQFTINFLLSDCASVLMRMM